MSQTCGRNALPEAQPSEFYRLQKVAEDGDASAQLSLGFIFDSGEGVPKDTVQAYAWHNLAAAGGLAKARNLRDLIAKKMTREQIAESQAISTVFKPRPRP